MIKTNLQSNISFIQQRSSKLDHECFAMKTESEKLKREKENSLRPLREELRNQERQRFDLHDQKKRIEEELVEIDKSLNKCDLFIENTRNRINDIDNDYKPRLGSLERDMHNHQFDIVAYSQESSCYSALLEIVNDSYNELYSWSNNRMQTDSDSRNNIENEYINKLFRYLQSICRAKQMVINRVEQLQKHIENVKKTNEITMQHYGQQRNIDPHLKKYKQDINIDQKTNENIENDIYKNIDRAKKIVLPSMFCTFMQHVKQANNPPIKQLIDLSRYDNYIQQQQTQQQSQQQSQSQSQQQRQPLSSSLSSSNTISRPKNIPPPRSSIQTQTQNNNNTQIQSRQPMINGHNNNNNNNSIGGRTKPPVPINKKPPISRSAYLPKNRNNNNNNFNQNRNNNHSMRGRRRAPVNIRNNNNNNMNNMNNNNNNRMNNNNNMNINNYSQYQ